jgi:hypothetical protein
LLQRLFDAQAKNKLEALLKAAKHKHNADRHAYKMTGSDDEMRQAVQAAILEGHSRSARSLSSSIRSRRTVASTSFSSR